MINGGAISGPVNGLAAIAVGVYVLVVTFGGNGLALLRELSQEKRFLVWIVCVFGLLLLYEVNETREVARPIIMIAVVGIAIRVLSDPVALEALRQLRTVLQGSTNE